MNPKTMTDYDLARGYLSGHDDCFTELVTRYKKLVFSIVMRMTNDRVIAEDLAQEIFLKVAVSMDRYHPEFKFSTWIMRISSNHVIDYRRKKKYESVPIEDVEFSLSAPEAETPELAYLRKEREDVLNGLIEKLPDMYKEPIVMYHKDNMSYQEISDSIKEPLSKVKNRIFRGRKMLKEALLMSKEASGYAM